MKQDDTISRRTILKGAALVGGVSMLTGCERASSLLTERMGEVIPDSVAESTSKQIDPAFHLLSRAGYGPWPGDLEHVKSIGTIAWINEQLDPDKIDDNAANFRASRFETIHLDGGTCFEYKKEVLFNEVARQSLIRSIYSKRQLLQVMVEFWSDHFNIDMSKGNCAYFKGSDDRTVIRKYALGNFRDLLKASAVSPAMLTYLDGNENKKSRPADIPNENYARELMELHTLGVHGGYTQQDVSEVARCLTGWRIQDKWQRGKVYFAPELHDDGEKEVLGHRIAAGGKEKDLDSVLDIVCAHPSTAKHLSEKLVRRFVAENPPSGLVASAASEFTRTNGDIKSVVRHILTSAEFAGAAGMKIKRPFQFIVSSLRAVGADTYAHNDVVDYLKSMGQCPFQYPTPDGYPDESAPWMAALLWRWNFALALTNNQIPSVKVDTRKLVTALGANDSAHPMAHPSDQHALAHASVQHPPDQHPSDQHPSDQHALAQHLMPHFLGRKGTRLELEALSPSAPAIISAPCLIGLILSSPAFQRC